MLITPLQTCLTIAQSYEVTVLTATAPPGVHGMRRQLSEQEKAVTVKHALLYFVEVWWLATQLQKPHHGGSRFGCTV